MKTARIVSDGTAIGTKVFVDGKELQRVVKVEFDPIVPGGVVFAKVTQHFHVEFDVTATLPPNDHA